MAMLIHQRDSLMELTFVNADDSPLGRYKQFEAFIGCPSGEPVRRVGSTGDGGKWVCDLEMLQAPCLIYSLGSNGQFDFEDGILALTPCHVHTYDCTYDGSSRHERHKYFKECIGAGKKPNFITYADSVARSGFPGVDLLKIDIEGSEFDVIAAWSETTRGLPRQILIEMHNYAWKGHSQTPALAALHFGKVAALGYAIVNQECEPNQHCGEFVYVRIEDTSKRLYA